MGAAWEVLKGEVLSPGLDASRRRGRSKSIRHICQHNGLVSLPAISTQGAAAGGPRSLGRAREWNTVHRIWRYCSYQYQSTSLSVSTLLYLPIYLSVYIYMSFINMYIYISVDMSAWKDFKNISPRQENLGIDLFYSNSETHNTLIHFIPFTRILQPIDFFFLVCMPLSRYTPASQSGRDTQWHVIWKPQIGIYILIVNRILCLLIQNTFYKGVYSMPVPF